MLFNNKTTNYNIPHVAINIGTEEITKTKSVKFLGLIIDDQMNWQEHIETCKSKISRSLYGIRPVKNILPKQELKTLYYSLIQSYLEYGIIIWGATH